MPPLIIVIRHYKNLTGLSSSITPKIGILTSFSSIVFIGFI